MSRDREKDRCSWKGREWFEACGVGALKFLWESERCCGSMMITRYPSSFGGGRGFYWLPSSCARPCPLPCFTVQKQHCALTTFSLCRLCGRSCCRRVNSRRTYKKKIKSISKDISQRADPFWYLNRFNSVRWIGRRTLYRGLFEWVKGCTQRSMHNIFFAF
jgi:hypothetical protein